MLFCIVDKVNEIVKEQEPKAEMEKPKNIKEEPKERPVEKPKPKAKKGKKNA